MKNSSKKDLNRITALKKAVALQYDINKDEAPRIIASGQGEMAKRIIKEAEKHNIPIEENKDIVEVLAQLNIGEQIPPELYRAVAEILTFIYQMEEL